MNTVYQKYLSSSIINKINSLSLRAKLAVEGFIIGLHKSPYQGFSIEFSEHRPYSYGDEIKHIDWKIMAKTDKLYIKQYEEETNLKCYILFDKSSSMKYASEDISKFEYAKTICAALSYLMIKQQDAVGLTLFDKKINYSIPARSKISHLNVLLKTLHNSSINGETKISNILHQLADSIKKRGLIILISDLLDNQKDVINGLRHFRYKGHEVIVFQILDEQEINFDFNKSAKFIDLETDEEIITDPRQIKNEYKKSMSAFCEKYRLECTQNNIDFIQISTSDSIDKALLGYLIKRTKLT